MADGSHGHHDAILVAAAVDADVRDPGLAWVRACAACAALLADLVTIRRAIPTAAIPTRPRDCRLTTARAAALERGRVRAWLAALGTARDTITRPVATSLVGLGLAGLLLGTIPAGVPLDGGAAVAAGDAMILEGGRALGPSPSLPASDAQRGRTPGGTGVPEAGAGVPTPLDALSVVLLALGFGVFGARRAATGVRRRP